MKTEPYGAAPTAKEMGLATKWKSPQFSFIYDNVSSNDFLATWKFKEETKKLDARRTEHTRTYNDPKTGLEVRCVAVEYFDSSALDWVMYFSNKGQADTPIIEKIKPMDMSFPMQDKKGFVIHRSTGEDETGASFAPVDTLYVSGSRDAGVLAPYGGRSSSGEMPFFNVDWGTGGVAVAIGWTGQWTATFMHEPDGPLTVQAGQQLTHFKLHPGETVRTPRILLVFWLGQDALRGNNLFRQVLIKYYLPRRGGKLVFTPICATVNNADPDGNYEGPHVRVMPALAERGYEVFWSDMDPQQWYPKGFPEGTGTWEPDLVKYPNGMGPIGEAAHKAGLGYLLWFEPERVHPGTKIDKEHPEWVMKSAGEWSQLYALHIPEARKWMTELLDKYIVETKLDWIRWDFNINPLGFWRRNDGPDRQGITEMQYIEGLYEMWDDLRARHPNLIVDVCAGGGRRLDYETLIRGLPLWHSDLQCAGPHADADQLQNAGLFRWIPMHGCGTTGFEPSYTFRSAMTAGNLNIAADKDGIINTAHEDTAADAKRTTAIFRKVRPYMLGDFYPLFPHVATPNVWFGYQFHRADENSGMALLFRRAECKEESTTAKLQGLDPKATYEVTFEESDEKKTMSGAELAQLKVSIAKAPDSTMLFYKKVK